MKTYCLLGSSPDTLLKRLVGTVVSILKSLGTTALARPDKEGTGIHLRKLVTTFGPWHVPRSSTSSLDRICQVWSRCPCICTGVVVLKPTVQVDTNARRGLEWVLASESVLASVLVFPLRVSRTVVATGIIEVIGDITIRINTKLLQWQGIEDADSIITVWNVAESLASVIFCAACSTSLKVQAVAVVDGFISSIPNHVSFIRGGIVNKAARCVVRCQENVVDGDTRPYRIVVRLIATEGKCQSRGSRVWLVNT